VVADEYEIDLDAFTVFVDALVHRYLKSSSNDLRIIAGGLAEEYARAMPV
jgi:hypothetical protein